MPTCSARRRASAALAALVAGAVALAPAAGATGSARSPAVEGVSAAAGAAGSSLYAGAGPRPGPAVLYAPPGTSPQLQNAPGSAWRADPILVSGASAYRRGEFLYQDWLYDDHGAAATMDPADPRNTGDAFAMPGGTFRYPTDRVYADNAADLVEVRVRPLPDATAIRVSLNTLKDVSKVALSVALGGTPGVTHPFPAGANVSAPADAFVTVHPGPAGLVGDLSDATTGVASTVPVTVTVDLLRRQIEVRIPHAGYDPTGRAVRLALGVGLWNAAAGSYLVPQPTADATHPGGSGAALRPAAFTNVAFRYAEPLPVAGDLVGDAATHPAWWRDRLQGESLARGDISPLFATVDFPKLAVGADDDMANQPGGVPQVGVLNRILASHTEVAQGVDHTVACLPAPASCPGPLQGRLQPYTVYVPNRPVPARGFGLMLQLHALATTYNLFSGTRHESQFADRGDGYLVVTPEARGPDGFYASLAEADTFEAWADAASHYRLDPDRTDVSGTSMGGIGTFKLAEQFPDLFARAHTTVGDSGDNLPVASLRNLPLLMWNIATDELVPAAGYLPTAQRLDSLGYRYGIQVFTPGEHVTLDVNDQFAPAADFLASTVVPRDPAHVTYVAVPSLDRPDLGLVGDHAYWLDRIRLRSTAAGAGRSGTDSGAAAGTLDVRSGGYGVADAPVLATTPVAGTLTGGTLPYPLAYAGQTKAWGPAVAEKPTDHLVIKATNVSSVLVDATRARVSCSPALDVTTDGPLTVTLSGCPGAGGAPGGVTLPRGHTVRPARGHTAGRARTRAPVAAPPAQPVRALAFTGRPGWAAGAGLLSLCAAAAMGGGAARTARRSRRAGEALARH